MSNRGGNDLTRFADPYAITVALDFTAAAKWGDRFADILAVSDQKLVDDDPVAPRKLGAERHLGLLRCFGSDVAPAIGDTMNVGIDANAGPIVTHGNDQVGCLASDARKFQQFINVVGHASLVSGKEYLTDFFDILGLCFIKTHRINRLFNDGCRQL